MSSATVGLADPVRLGERLMARAVESGTASHPYPASNILLTGPDASRNLADAVHLLCLLHGRHPGIIDRASARCADPAARAWLEAAAEEFAAERVFLTRLVVAAGPIPGTPGSAESEAAVITQRGALDMLARSERNGCSLGAALGLVADWIAIRTVLEAAARRFGIDSPPFALGRAGTLARVAEAFTAANASLERALLFGAEQIAIQHHGLWALLDARREARTRS